MARSIIGCALILSLMSSCIGDGGVVGPLVEPVWNPLGFDLDAISLSAQGDQTVIAGGPGAAPDEDETVTVDLLDRISEFKRVAVAEDGSFTITMRARPDEVFRLQGDTGAVADITCDSSSGGPAMFAEHLRCLLSETLYPPFGTGPILQLGDVNSSSTEVLEIVNECDSPVTITEATLHYGDDGFAVQTEAVGTTLSLAQQAEVIVTLECDAAGERHDLLFLVTNAGRAVVTLEGSCR